MRTVIPYKPMTKLGIVLTLISLGVTAEVLVRVDLIDGRFFPPPSAVLKNIFFLLVWDPDFQQHMGASTRRFLMGTGVAFAVSMIALLVTITTPFARGLMNGLVAVLYPLPKSALLPFFFLLFGLTGAAHVALIGLGVATLLLTSLDAGLLRLEQAGYLGLARSLRISQTDYVFKVVLPGLVPELLHGLKLGMSHGLVLLMVTEMIATRFGLGVFMWTSWDQFKITDLYSVFYLLSLAGFSLFTVFGALAEAAGASQRGLSA